MPTATGRMTADERREADRARWAAARRAVTARITTLEELTATADAFEESLRHHRAGQAAGTIPAYQRFTVQYPAGAEIKEGRITIDEGRARSYGLSDVLTARGVPHHCMQSFGLHAGRDSVVYVVEA
jgi:hypothetical protein